LMKRRLTESKEVKRDRDTNVAKSDIRFLCSQDLTADIKTLGKVSDSSVSARHCDAVGDSLSRCVAGGKVINSFIVTARDSDSKRRDVGGDVFEVKLEGKMRGEAIIDIKDEKNGNYRVEYTIPEIGGELKLLVRIGGEHIKGSPFAISISASFLFGIKSERITLSNYNRTAVNNACFGHQYVLGNQTFSVGRHQWTFRIDEFLGWIMFGVTSSIPVITNSFSPTTNWGISPSQIYKEALSATQATQFCRGDVITVTLDCDACTLSISEASRGLLGTLTSLPSGRAWYPHFHFLGDETQITFV